MKILILGGGVAGMNVMAHLRRKHDVTLLEKESSPGGLLRSFKDNGFTYDITGHLIHSLTGEFQKFISAAGIELQNIKRKAAVFVENKYIDYPIQLNIPQLSTDMKNTITDQILKSEPLSVSRELDFETWVRSIFGDALAELFFISYNGKLFNTHISDISSNWFSRYLPVPDKVEFIRSLAGKYGNDAGYNASFNYPLSGGIEILPKKMYGLLKENIILDKEITKIDTVKKEVFCGDEKYTYDALISTIPFPEFIRLSGKGKSLKPSWVNVHDLNIGVSAADFPHHWAYYPQPELPFYRIGSFSNIAPHLAPDGKHSFYIETSYRDNAPDKDKILKAVESLGIFAVSDIESIVEINIKYAYPIHNKDYPAIKSFMKSAASDGVHFYGRSGSWEYLSIADIFNRTHALLKAMDN
ncbi:FAD-dependent oxidoreductase [bacterium]|nr:FAD-dependent oxidoreductase [bacterium]